MQSVVTDRPPPATWPEFWLEVARKARLWVRSRWRADDQPGWAPAASLVIAAASALSYAWRANRPVNIEIYYAAAVRSMTLGPSNFFFGAFDPAATVTTDKLPGAFWLQAISVGLFGAHPWALVLPQVIEGTLSVSWTSLVTIWPSADRPYIDGSASNSAFQQVFVYNGFGRLDQATPDQLVNRTIKLGIPIAPPPSCPRASRSSRPWPRWRRAARTRST